MSAYRIVLTDDHVLVRQGLRRIIESTADLQVIAETGSGVELLAILRKVTADLVILDIAMPGMRGLEAIHEINALHPHPKTLVLSMYGDRDYVSAAMAAGASGYLLKEDADTQLFSAIDRIQRDRTYMSPRLVEELTHAWAGARRNGDHALKTEPLTVREREILKMIAEARLSREIADMLHISLRTVEHHRASILTKLQLRRTAELVRYAVARNYL